MPKKAATKVDLKCNMDSSFYILLIMPDYGRQQTRCKEEGSVYKLEDKEGETIQWNILKRIPDVLVS